MENSKGKVLMVYIKQEHMNITFMFRKSVQLKTKRQKKLFKYIPLETVKVKT